MFVCVCGKGERGKRLKNNMTHSHLTFRFCFNRIHANKYLETEDIGDEEGKQYHNAMQQLLNSRNDSCISECKRAD